MADPDQKALPGEAVDGVGDLTSWSCPLGATQSLVWVITQDFILQLSIGLEELITWYSGGTKIQKTFPCSTEKCATLMSFDI